MRRILYLDPSVRSHWANSSIQQRIAELKSSFQVTQKLWHCLLTTTAFGAIAATLSLIDNRLLQLLG